LAVPEGGEGLAFDGIGLAAVHGQLRHRDRSDAGLLVLVGRTGGGVHDDFAVEQLEALTGWIRQPVPLDKEETSAPQGGRVADPVAVFVDEHTSGRTEHDPRTA
jgi:hypothetical protein